MIKIEIIGKPVPASRPRVFKSGGRTYTKPHLAHEAILKKALKAYIPANPISETVSVYMEFVFSRPKTSKALAPKADLDNLCKLPLDVATHLGFWVDDYLVTTLVASKRFTQGQELPRTIITIHTSPNQLHAL